MKLLIAGMAATVLPSAARAQDMAGMPGMTMPMPAAKPAPARRHAPAPHAAHPAKSGTARPDPASAPGDATGMAGMPGMTMPPSPASPGTAIPAGTASSAGDAAAPPPPRGFYADASYGRPAMERARARMAREQGGQSFYQVLFNLAEYQARQGRNGYRWDGEAWLGGDIDRFALRTEGAGTVREGVESAEIQALYAHAIGPYSTLQAGIRQDIRPTPARTYASLGVEGLAPYEFETEARLFVSTHGEVLARLEAWYDQRITQRFVLQPRVELNLAAQSTRAVGVGRGLRDAELGVRLRYEIARRFAPYLGISYEAQAGRTADYARAAGHDPTTTSYVAGIRFWF